MLFSQKLARDWGRNVALPWIGECQRNIIVTCTVYCTLLYCVLHISGGTEAEISTGERKLTARWWERCEGYRTFSLEQRESEKYGCHNYTRDAQSSRSNLCPRWQKEIHENSSKAFRTYIPSIISYLGMGNAWNGTRQKVRFVEWQQDNDQRRHRQMARTINCVLWAPLIFINEPGIW